VNVAVLSGGVGGARFLRGLLGVVQPGNVSIIGNVADDLELLGLRISPDLDSILYTLTGRADDAAQEPRATDAAREDRDVHAADGRSREASARRVCAPTRSPRRTRSSSVSTSSIRFGASSCLVSASPAKRAALPGP